MNQPAYPVSIKGASSLRSVSSTITSRPTSAGKRKDPGQEA